MHVQAHHTLEELRQLAKAHRGQIFGIHLQAVLLARQGQTAAAIGAALGFCRKTVAMWISHYNAQGLAGLRPGHSPGRPCSLSPAQLQELQARLNQGATPEDGVSALRGGRCGGSCRNASACGTASTTSTLCCTAWGTVV